MIVQAPPPQPDHVTDHHQVWSHEGAGQYAENCQNCLMSGFGYEAEDPNVISGQKIC